MTPGLRTLALYVAAGLGYIGLGLLDYRFLLSWVEGAGFLLLAVWVVPAMIALALKMRR